MSYKKLWKLLIDRGMQKKDLQKQCDISAASIAKLGKKCQRYYRSFNEDMLRVKL